MTNLQLFSKVFLLMDKGFGLSHWHLYSNETSVEKIDEKMGPGFSVLLTKMQLASSVRGVLTETHI